MKLTSRIEKVIYCIVLFLIVAVLMLMAISPADFTEAGLVYRGF
jgi:hypothetical protein